MPLVAQAAGDQGKGVACIGGLGHGAGLGQHKAGVAIGRGKTAVGVQARAAPGLALGAGPLLRGGFQLCPAQAGDVQVAPARAFAVLVPDGLGAVVGEQAGQVGARGQQGLHAPRHFGDDAPVRPGLAWRWHRGAHAADAAFAVGHGAFLFAPGGGGQQQVGIACGGRGGIGVLQHHELGALQGAAHQGLVGQAVRGVGAGNPQQLDLAVGSGLEQLHRRLAGRGGHLGHAPQGGHFGAVLRVGQVAVGAELVGQRAHLAPAHGVGLAGERERPRAGFADLAAGQVQVDEGGVVVGAAYRLVQALAIQAERGAAAGRACVHARKPACGLQQLGRGNAAVLLHHGGRGVLHLGGQGVPALGVRGDEGLVHPALLQHAAQHAVVQPHVRARLQRQVQVGQLGGVGAARVAHDDAQLRVGALGVFDAPEHDGVRPGRVGAGDEQRGRVGQVLVAGRGRVGAQRGLVARHGAAHAQA